MGFNHRANLLEGQSSEGAIMEFSTELILSIGLAVTLPLLGIVAGCLYTMKSDMKNLTKTVEDFHEFFEAIRKSLEHNRNEHTQMMALSNAALKEITDNKQDIIDRITLSEERLKK